MAGPQESRISSWVPDGWYEPPYRRPRALRRCRCRPAQVLGWLLLALGAAAVDGCLIAVVAAYLNSVQGDYAGQPGAASGVVVLAVLGILAAIALTWLGATLIRRGRPQ